MILKKLFRKTNNPAKFLKRYVPWCIDYVEVLKDYIIIKGWAYHDKEYCRRNIL